MRALISMASVGLHMTPSTLSPSRLVYFTRSEMMLAGWNKLNVEPGSTAD